MKKIYFDAAAANKVPQKIAKIIEKFLVQDYGNPSSIHAMGEKAREEVEDARKKIAEEINAKPQEIIFTSGATESNNLAIQGLAGKNPNKKTIILSAIEHPSVREVCNYLKSKGYRIIEIPVDSSGILKINFLEQELKINSKNILLVSVMHVSNIIGTIQDIENIGNLCAHFNIPFHTDAAQALGKISIDVKKMNISLLSASGHKIGAPKGIGFLYKKENIQITPLIFGGGQERNLRSGTENVPAIVSFAEALKLAKKTNKKAIKDYRDKMITELAAAGCILNGSQENRLFNNIHMTIPNEIESDLLVRFLSQKGIYVSTGSACDSKKEKEDHVLKAIGVKEKKFGSSIRISLPQDCTEKDVNTFIKEIKSALRKLKLN